MQIEQRRAFAGMEIRELAARELNSFLLHEVGDYTMAAISTDIPARLDRLPWSAWHWKAVIALGVSWLLAADRHARPQAHVARRRDLALLRGRHGARRLRRPAPLRRHDRERQPRRA